MMKFLTEEINLGTLNENRYYTAAFPFIGSIGIVNFSSSCGCTEVILDKANSCVKVTVSTGLIPKHLEKQGYAAFAKSVSVHHLAPEGNNEEFILKIRGVITKS